MIFADLENPIDKKDRVSVGEYRKKLLNIDHARSKLLIPP